MTKWCIVPTCKTGSGSNKSKRSVFRVPRDLTQLKKWEAAIPGIAKLEPRHVVCENHFEPKYIYRQWVKRDSNGRIIAQVAYKHPQLDKLAVPSKFGDIAPFDQNASSGKNAPSQDPPSQEPPSQDPPSQDPPSQDPPSQDPPSQDPPSHDPPSHDPSQDFVNCKSSSLETLTTPVPAKDDLPNECMEYSNSIDEFDGFGQLVEISTESISTHEQESTEMKNISSVELPVVLEKQVGVPLMEVACSDSAHAACSNQPVQDAKALVASAKPFTVCSSVIIREDTNGASSSTCAAFSGTIPEPWSVAELRTDTGQCLLFSLAITKRENGIDCPVTYKCVTLNTDRTINYYVYGRPIDTQNTNLDNTVRVNERIPEILKRFQGMNVCGGLGVVNMHHLPDNSAFQDYVGHWHIINCPLVSKKRRCESCAKTRKLVRQRASRSHHRSALTRIHEVLNPADNKKLLAMRKKLRRERRNKYLAEKRVSHLKICLQKQEEEVASIKLETFDEKCSKLKVPSGQKAALKEIIAAASSKNDRGRRYTEDWLMLCMLMNIRSPAYYEFLRKNEVLPLPCKRTIRSYFAMIDSKCGFDENFAAILKKHFSNKTPLQRHGVLLLDEINLRKSVAVCSKNLTYVGLTDLGDDGLQSTDINDQATHGLVFMFQPLADSYTQPIAVFASKNSVKGDELAKLVVKGISYLEGCGATIHGVIADGAATNAKMWSLLGVSGLMRETKTWFTHPLDDERKVFAFSDTPHLIKNIRNRLFNKKKLRLKSTENYISWEYFNVLYELDKDHPGNARACPKITARHVVLDNTSKMRVRLATQIFSNSVAQGLAFYQSHGCDGLNGCEETIKFCKRINDMFDALNRKSPNQGLTPHSDDFKVLEDSLQWLNTWESSMLNGDIKPEEYLTAETSRGLRISLQSTMDMCRYLINRYEFEYLLSGKVNQDNLEKFFGTIRQAAGCNDHPNCPTFLQLYKLLSVYGVIKPPKSGNCTVSDENSPPILISISDLKAAYGDKVEAKSSRCMQEIKKKLDTALQHGDWEADDVIDSNPDHDYALAPVLDCIIYYVTGYLCKQVLKRYKSCTSCERAVRLNSGCTSSLSQLVTMKTRGGLIHANLHFFRLIRHIEASFAKYSFSKNVFDLTVNEVLETYEFSFPCAEHASEVLSYAIVYYIRLRMRQHTHQRNVHFDKKYAQQNKMAKWTQH